MNRLALLATTALVAFGASFPALADTATVTQTSEVNGTANQHQPGAFFGGATDDTATIVQVGGNGDQATQEQGRLNDVDDFAFTGTESITQTNDTVGALASQEDNGNGGDSQTISQTGNTGSATAIQTVNAEFGRSNIQTTTQTMNNGALVEQTIGINPSVGAGESFNAQIATETGQSSSSIVQTIDGVSNGNTQTATQNTGGAANGISALIVNGSNNTVLQTQDVNASTDTQLASITSGSGNYVEQYQGMGSSASTQNTTVDFSSSGRALQYQGNGVSGGSETIVQNGAATNNQAGQGQGNSNNVATITQTGGSGDVAIQNQGLQSGAAGFMFVNGSGQIVHS